MRRDPVTAFIALGANLGDARQAVEDALQALDRLPDTRVSARSRLYCTAPHEATGPDFINAVALVDTALSPLDLLHALQALEVQAGRERPYRHAPRTLDLDLIFHGDAQLDTPALTLPHPRWQERAFVLWPLAEICPERVTLAMLDAVRDQTLERCA